MTVFTAVIAEVTFGMTVRIVPTDVISFPTTMSTGPTAAAISAIFTMVSCTGPGMVFHTSANLWSVAEMFCRTGWRTVARLFPMSAPTSFREFRVIWNWSIGSSVSLKVFSTLPEKSPRVPDRSSG